MNKIQLNMLSVRDIAVSFGQEWYFYIPDMAKKVTVGRWITDRELADISGRKPGVLSDKNLLSSILEKHYYDDEEEIIKIQNFLYNPHLNASSENLYLRILNVLFTECRQHGFFDFKSGFSPMAGADRRFSEFLIWAKFLTKIKEYSTIQNNYEVCPFYIGKLFLRASDNFGFNKALSKMKMISGQPLEIIFPHHEEVVRLTPLTSKSVIYMFAWPNKYFIDARFLVILPGVNSRRGTQKVPRMNFNNFYLNSDPIVFYPLNGSVSYGTQRSIAVQFIEKLGLRRESIQFEYFGLDTRSDYFFRCLISICRLLGGETPENCLRI